jgi:hypothetical protein
MNTSDRFELIHEVIRKVRAGEATGEEAGAEAVRLMAIPIQLELKNEKGAADDG